MPEPRSRALSSLLAHAPGEPASPRARRRLSDLPAWVCGVALALPLALVYLAVHPPSADLAAATYRSDLFARHGLTIWDTGWYDGHALPAYSLLSPALGAWIGLRELLALSGVLGAATFGLLAQRTMPAGGARVATLALAFGFCCELPSGRVPYDLGAAIAFASLAVLAGPRLRGARVPLAFLLGLLAAVASPVAGAFLALASLAWGLASIASGKRSAAPVAAALCLAGLLPVLLLALLFPEGGYEPFAGGAFWPQLVVALAVAALLPRGGLSVRAHRAIRMGALLYAISLLAAWAIRTPMGSNAERLGELVGPPLVAGVLWEASRFAPLRALPTRLAGALGRHGDRLLDGRRLLLALAPLLLYWQLATSIDDQVALAGDPTVNASFYAPLRAELRRLSRDGPIRVEVPLTGAHWESAYLPGDGVSIARGWDRQLDTRYASLFYLRSGATASQITASAYERWLDRNAIAYVALPHARLDGAGEAEARLIERGLPYLRQVWRSREWRLFAVTPARPLAQPPAKLLALGSDSFALRVPRAGSYEVRLRFTSYWAPITVGACVSRAPGGFTEVRAARLGTVRVGVSFSLSRALHRTPRC
ncbi:MAG: hypothetical protein ACYCU0_06615 [Solirubrobacteraceae bacterium]